MHNTNSVDFLTTVSNNTIDVDSLVLNLDKVGKVALVAGGFAQKGQALSNEVIISNTIIHDVYGGGSQEGCANGNQVTIKSGVEAGLFRRSQTASITYGSVYGGMVNKGLGGSVASQNSVLVEADNENFLTGVYGGENRAGAGDADANSVVLTSGHIREIIGGHSAVGNATENEVVISGGLVADQDKTSAGNVYAAQALMSASRNKVFMTEGKVIGSVYSGAASEASNNEVCITGGELNGSIFAGEGKKANNNQVVISGGAISGSIYAGYGESAADGNRIEIQGAADLAKARLFGSNLSSSTGNTLNIRTSSVVVQEIGNFQNLNFYIDEPLESGAAVLKVVNEDYSMGRSSTINQTDVSSSSINVYLADQAVPLESGQEIVLLENAQGLVTGNFDGSIIYNKPEGLLDYGLSFNVTPTTLGIQVDTVEAKPETESFLSSNLSRMAFVNQGSDLVVGQGLAAVRESIQNGQHLFLAVQTGSNHYNVDSYIDLEGESLIMGGSWSVGAPNSQVTMGAFFESGWGDYEVENALTPLSILKGKGETHYQGGGLLAYWDQYPSADKGLYAEASVRLGRADLSYQTVASSSEFDYDIKATYWAAHVGMGYRYAFDNNNVDLYTKYFYSHQDSDDFMLDQNSVKMNSIKSKRWRTGLSYRHRGFIPEGCVFDWQASLAYEYEFDGKAEGSVDGYRIHDSELEGSSGIGEVSITFMPSEDSSTRVRASIQGFVGVREGYIGQIRWYQTF